MKTRHLHLVIDDKAYFALLNLQSLTGKSKTSVIEDLLVKENRCASFPGNATHLRGLIYEKEK